MGKRLTRPLEVSGFCLIPFATWFPPLVGSIQCEKGNQAEARTSSGFVQGVYPMDEPCDSTASFHAVFAGGGLSARPCEEEKLATCFWSPGATSGELSLSSPTCGRSILISPAAHTEYIRANNPDTENTPRQVHGKLQHPVTDPRPSPPPPPAHHIEKYKGVKVAASRTEFTRLASASDCGRCKICIPIQMTWLQVPPPLQRRRALHNTTCFRRWT